MASSDDESLSQCLLPETDVAVVDPNPNPTTENNIPYNENNNTSVSSLSTSMGDSPKQLSIA